MAAKKIAVIVGSLRKESFNRKIAKQLIALAPASLQMEIVEIGALSLYNQDFDDASPAEWEKFRDQIRAADGLLFVTPEYNRSVPGVLKNAIDIGSRPNGKNVWNGKPGGVVSVSVGAAGGVAAHHNLRQSLVAVNVLCLAQPEVFIGGAAKLFDDQGNLTNDSTKEFLKKFITAYAAWVEKQLNA